MNRSRTHTLAHFLFLFQRQVKELFRTLHGFLLQFERDAMAGYLEEAIVQTALPDLIDQLLLGGLVIAVEYCALINFVSDIGLGKGKI